MIHIDMPWRLSWIGSNSFRWALDPLPRSNEQKAIDLTAVLLLPLIGSPLVAWLASAVCEVTSFNPFEPSGWVTIAAVVGWYSLGIMASEVIEMGVMQVVFTVLFNFFAFILAMTWFEGFFTALPDWIGVLLLFPVIWPIALSIAWSVFVYASILFAGILDVICWPFVARPSAVSAAVARKLARPPSQVPRTNFGLNHCVDRPSQSSESSDTVSGKNGNWRQFLHWLAGDFGGAFAASGQNGLNRWAKLVALVVLLPCGIFGTLVYFFLVGTILAVLHIIYVIPRILVALSQIALELTGVTEGNFPTRPAEQTTSAVPSPQEPQEHWLETKWWNWCKRIQDRWQTAGVPVLAIGPRRIDLFVPLYALAFHLLEGRDHPPVMSISSEPSLPESTESAKQASAQPTFTMSQDATGHEPQSAVGSEQGHREAAGQFGDQLQGGDLPSRLKHSVDLQPNAEENGRGEPICHEGTGPSSTPIFREEPLFLEQFVDKATEHMDALRAFFVLGCAYKAGANSLRKAEKVCNRFFVLSQFNELLKTVETQLAKFPGGDKQLIKRGPGEEPEIGSNGLPKADGRNMVDLTARGWHAWKEAGLFLKRYDTEYSTYERFLPR